MDDEINNLFERLNTLDKNLDNAINETKDLEKYLDESEKAIEKSFKEIDDLKTKNNILNATKEIKKELKRNPNKKLH